MSLRTRLLILVIVAMLVPAIVAAVRFIQNRTSEIKGRAGRPVGNGERYIRRPRRENSGHGPASLRPGRPRPRHQRQGGLFGFPARRREEYTQYTGSDHQPRGKPFCDLLRTNRTLDLRDREYFKKALNAHGAVTLQPAFGR